jgi:hypothetical protein
VVTQNSSLVDEPVGAVFTPLRWAKWLVREFGIVSKWVDGAKVCDPTAGAGVFAHALMDEAAGMGLDVSDKALARLFLIERERPFIQDFQSAFRLKYERDFPEENAICADIVLHNPRQRFDILLGNPPWANFNDLPNAYKNVLKSIFIQNGLVADTRAMLLGSSRVDFSALVVTITLNLNLREKGEAFYFLPLSLFLNDGAHSGFRRNAIGGSTFGLIELLDFSESQVFQEVTTRFGVARFQRDCVTAFPIPYRIETKSGWISRLAAPVGDLTAPLSVFDFDHEFEQLSRPSVIEIRESQKPRQGVNTCGANSAFIFDEPPADVPAKFIFPLVTKECFRENMQTPKKHILLPYDDLTGRPLDRNALLAYPSLLAYLESQKRLLTSRKGTLLNTWIKRGIWWACLGVGEYCFAPFKIVWEAYGKSNFNPRIFSSRDGKPWQANQAMQAFIPCFSLAEAEDLLDRLKNSNIERYLKSLNIQGTCNWAQPGRIKRFLNFVKDDSREHLELQFS